MTDLATLYHNRAFSPLHGPLPAPNAEQQPQPPPHLQLTDLRTQQRQRGLHPPSTTTLPNGQQLQPVGKQPPSSSSSSLSLAPAPVSMRSPSSSSSTSSASSSSSSSSRRRGSVASDDGRRRRDRQPACSGRAERRQQKEAATAAPPAMSAEAVEEEEHRWLLHSSRVARAYSEQLAETEAPYYPKLIEQELIVDDSRDEADADGLGFLSSGQSAEQREWAASSPVSPSSSHSSPVIRLPASVSSRSETADLISSYEQLAFIRFPPSLWSLVLHRSVYAALGLLHEPWPVWKESRSEDDEVWWLWWLWCWQAVWALACVLGLGWLCWLRVVESESQSLLTRALLSACDVASVCCALLLSHAVLSHRMLGSRVYFLHRNSSSPRSAAAAVNRAVCLSLAALLVIAAAGVYLDTRTVPSSFPSVSSSPVLQPAVVSLQLTAQAWLWLSCLLLLRLQYAAGICVLLCLVDVHIMRVEQARKAVTTADAEEEAVAAQVVDIELSVHDLADRLGGFVSVLLAACVLCAATAAISAADGADAASTAGGAGAALRLLFPLLVATLLLQAVARLNQSCSRFRSAVLSFPLLHPRLLPAAASGSAAAAVVMPPAASSLWMSIPCPEVSLPVCGVRLSYGGLWLFVLLWSALLLWLTQTGRLS